MKFNFPPSFLIFAAAGAEEKKCFMQKRKKNLAHEFYWEMGESEAERKDFF